jgi:hypothetical protein
VYMCMLKYLFRIQEHARKEHTQLVESITAMLASSLSNRTNLVSAGS